MVDPQSLFVFSDFDSLGIANTACVNGFSSFDTVFSNQLTSFTITNDDPVTDSFSAEITSELAVDPTGTLSGGDT